MRLPGTSLNSGRNDLPARIAPDAAAPGESRVLNNGVPKIEERRIPAISGPHPRNSDNRR